jgi:hypothetical protein
MAVAVPIRPSVERRLLAFLAVIAATAVAGVLAILPYRLYARDVRQAEVAAHRVGSLLHVALGHALQQGASERELSDLVNRFQGIAAVELRLRPLAPGEVHPAATNGRASSERRDTDLTYHAAPILDGDGHTWLATMHFDLSPMKRESLRLILDLVLAVVLGSLAFSAAIFWLIRRALLQPLHEVTERVEEFAAGRDPGPPPRSGSRELASLLEALDRARGARVG